ncbi:VOC family protein [Streptomyces sp. NPDC000877]|uniref:VOC family protein n=1 Tax=unclassified Streptomyces TaxID=2593676 RepID=UPI00331E1C98
MPIRPGLPSLVDVTYQDLDVTKNFYSGLFGWTYDNTLDPTGHYTYAVRDGQPIAGLRPAQPGQPPAWTLYLQADSVPDTAEQVKSNGGHVIYQNEAPGQGHVLIAADPTGAVIGFWQPTVAWDFRSAQPGSLVWAELHTRDGKSADDFYRHLFAYEQQQIGDGASYDYSTYALDYPVLGRLRVGDDHPTEAPAAWTVYFGVDPATGTDALAARAVELGGTLLREPEDIPAGRYAVLADVTGAAFAVIDNSKATR